MSDKKIENLPITGDIFGIKYDHVYDNLTLYILKIIIKLEETAYTFTNAINLKKNLKLYAVHEFTEKLIDRYFKSLYHVIHRGFMDDKELEKIVTSTMDALGETNMEVFTRIIFMFKKFYLEFDRSEFDIETPKKYIESIEESFDSIKSYMKREMIEFLMGKIIIDDVMYDYKPSMVPFEFKLTEE